MGKRRKRMKMKKYAKKYATKRAALGGAKVENKVVVIDLVNGEEVKEEETVQVITNKPKTTQITEKPIPIPEPELQIIQIEEPASTEKMAVHKLAKELGIKSSELVKLINSDNLGFTVKSHMSSVTGEQITQIKTFLEEE